MKIYQETVENVFGSNHKVRFRLLDCLGKRKTFTRSVSNCNEAAKLKKRAERAYRLGGTKGLQKLLNKKEKIKTVGDAVRKVIENELTAQHIGRSNLSNLKMLLKYPIAGIAIEVLASYDVTEHCLLRYSEKNHLQAQTLIHDVINLLSALNVAHTIYDFPAHNIDESKTKSALKSAKLIGESAEIGRRATKSEISKIETFIKEGVYAHKNGLPLLDIISLVLLITARRSEIVKALWGDVDFEKKTLTLRKRKNPNGKIYSDTIILCDKALAIIYKQPRGERDTPIFPYKADSISDAWRVLMNKLNIGDLRFHDMRVEAICRLFERGYSAVEISKISGHRCLDTLNNRYLPLIISL